MMPTSVLYASPSLADQHIDEVRQFFANEHLARSVKGSTGATTRRFLFGRRRLRPAPAR